MPLMPLTIGRTSACATRTPIWKLPESALSLPNRTRSNGPSAASRPWMAVAMAAAVRCGSQSAVVDRQQHGLVDADAGRVAQLLVGLGRARA